MCIVVILFNAITKKDAIDAWKDKNFFRYTYLTFYICIIESKTTKCFWNDIFSQALSWRHKGKNTWIKIIKHGARNSWYLLIVSMTKKFVSLNFFLLVSKLNKCKIYDILLSWMVQIWYDGSEMSVSKFNWQDV